MRKVNLCLLVLLASAGLLAASKNIGLDAFNRSVSAATRGNAVFSPVSFEVDCVIMSEAFGALTRAKYAETMGVLNGLENIYRPLHDELTKSEGRKFSFLCARAFCLPDERKANAVYRKWMQDSFSAEAFGSDFRKGAECWFRARTDGETENFEIPANAAALGYYSYYDLSSVRCSWKEPFPTNNTREIKFTLADGTEKSVPAMCDLRIADIWSLKRHAVVRLPLTDGSWFFALLPNEGTQVRDIRAELTSSKLNDLIFGIKSITESGISHDAAAIVIPVIDVMTETDLRPSFSYFNFPLEGMERMEKGVCPRFVKQCLRFRLDENGLNAPVAEKPADQIVRATADTKRFVINRPFLFFVYHEPTSSVLVVGQFMGQ